MADTNRIDGDLCTLCGACVEICVRHVLKMDGETVEAAEPTHCILCGHCSAVCPVDAIRVPGVVREEFVDAPKPHDLPSPQQLMGLMRSRRSVRKFLRKPVERDLIEKVIEAGRFAPTGGNRQPIRYAVVHTPEKMETVRNLTVLELVDHATTMDKAIKKIEATGRPLSLGEQINRYYVDIFHEIAELNSE
ncbi:nitroreductase family protein, partial [Thermodesulfobacteriota bacterium]